MLDAKRLLDQFLGGQAGRAAGGFGGSDSGVSGGALGELAKQFGGRSGKPGGGGAGGGLGGMLGNLSNEQLMGAGGLAAILLGSKGGRSMGSSALKLGGLAAVGAMAYKAYQDWQASQQAGAAAPTASGPARVTGSTTPVLPAPSGTPFNPAGEEAQQSLGRKLLRAMIAAAKADGHVDAAEQASIFGQMDKLDLHADDKAFVIDELRAPLDVDAVAKAASTPEEAAEIYTASLLAIDVDSPAERGYLALLAARLKLDDALVQHLHVTVEGATEKVPVQA